jgi:hypothetical protein
MVIGFACTPAEGGVFEDIYEALEFYATPSGFPITSTSDGMRVNGQRSGRLRIVPAALGQGHELQLDRSFGVDTRGRPEILRLGGVAELELAGLTQLTLGYYGKQKFRTVRGNMAINSLDYSYRTSLGVQDMEFNGTLLGGGIAEINPLGFYEVGLTLSNSNSELVLDGLVVRDEQTMNFDIGPINIQGNIFYDAFVAFLTSLGVDTTELEAVFPASPIDQIDDAIQRELQSLGVIADATLTLGESASLLSPDTARDIPIDVAGLTALPADDTAVEPRQPSTVPEPGTLILLALGGATVWHAQQRR